MKFLKKTIWLLLAAGVVLLGVRAIKHKQEQQAQIPPAKTYAVTVHTVTIKEREAILTLPFVAQVKNDNDTVIASKLAAKVVMIHKAGARVKADEAVARLDDRDIRAKADAIEAQILQAKTRQNAALSTLAALRARHARTKKLLAVRGASQEEYENETAQIARAEADAAAAKAQIRTLKANLQEVRQLLDYTLLKTPVSGTVARTFVNPGDMAMPGKPLMRIRAKAGDYLLLKLPRDLKAEAVRFEGTLYTLYPLESSENGLLLYRTALLNRGLPTGTYVDVEVVTFRGKGLILPPDALLDRDGRRVVLTIEGERALPRPVTVIGEGTEGIAVQDDGLAGKKLAVAKPDVLLRLTSGIPVKVAGDWRMGEGNR